VKELPEGMIKHIHCNDLNESAVKLTKENIELNSLNEAPIEVFNLDANKFLEDAKGFDYIDIDPFGSPNFLLNSSIRRIARGGVLAVTATDTGALTGSFPTAGKMKYWARTAIIPQMHEIGLRILARKVILMGMQNQRALEPIFSYHHEHYYRIFFKVTKGKTAASKMFDSVDSWYHYCKSCGFSNSKTTQLISCPHCTKKLTIIGPCYNGPLQDKDVLEEMKEINHNEKIEKRLSMLLEESKMNEVGFFDSHDICEKNNGTAPKISFMIDQLEKKGFKAAQSTSLRTGVKTTAPFKEFLEVLGFK